MRSQVQVLIGPPLNNIIKINLGWGISSAGRAPALHAGGQRFDPAILHHLCNLSSRKLNISSIEIEFIFDFRIKVFQRDLEMIFKNVMLKSLIFS